MCVLNLPRESTGKRHSRWSGPHEPKRNNTFLRPLVNELWAGVRFDRFDIIMFTEVVESH